MSKTSRIVVTLAALLLSVRGALAQTQAQDGTGVIQGTVQAESGAPLLGVTVTIVGTRLGAVTRADGRYTITGVAPGTHQLRARRLGYALVEQPVTVAGGETVNEDLRMTSVAVSLDELVVVGYGSQRKRDVTGSVGSVSNAEFATIPVPRVDQAIVGKVPGVQIQTTNAQPGSTLRIRVRGGNSLRGNNEPLVVVDGVIGAELNQIDPNDIESVDILKDASATAIYGARAANGVILVTTKRGEGGMRFSYSGYTGVQETSKEIDVLTGDEFARLYMRNPGRDQSITLDTLGPATNTNWQDVVYRSAPLSNHQISVNGAMGGTSLLVSAALLNQSGIVQGSDFGRGSLRINADQELGTRARVSTRLHYSRSVGNEVRVNDGYGSAGGPITMMALRFAPVIPVRDTAGNFSGPLIPSQTMDNPLAIATLRDDKSTTNYLIGNLFGEYDLLPGLTVRSSVGYTQRSLLNQRYSPRVLRQHLNRGQANVDNSHRTTWIGEHTITWRGTLADRHDLTVLGGFTAQQTRNTTSTQQGEGFTSDQLGYRRLNLAELVTGNSTSSRERLLSYLGRLNYAFAGRYLLTASVRVDGSSKFATNNKWGTFPSAAVAWRLSDEPFFRVPKVSELKLRASYGETGSEAIGAYQSLSSWSVGAPFVIGVTRFNNGANLSRLANPNLRWETTRQYDIGLDLGLFDDRVSLVADVYDKRTSDLLYDKQVSYVTGFEDYPTNIGKFQNRGIELSLDTRHSVGPFQIELGGNISANRSKVLDLGGDHEFFLDGVNGSLPRYRPAAIVRVGEPLGNYYGWIWDGIFQNQAEVDASGQAGARVGGMKLRDISGPDSVPDGRIDSFDRTILGNAQPDYMFAQTGTIRYKSVSVSYILRGVQGFEVANLNREGMSTPGASTNQLREVLNYWTPQNPTNTMTALGVGPLDQMTSRWVEDGSFIRLQNLTLAWDVPQRLTARMRLGQMRLFFSGQNLFTDTDYSWYDPEVSSRGTSDLDLGWDDSSYPGIKTYTLGWNVVF